MSGFLFLFGLYLCLQAWRLDLECLANSVVVAPFVTMII
jgi:hypothetical protein